MTALGTAVRSAPLKVITPTFLLQVSRSGITDTREGTAYLLVHVDGRAEAHRQVNGVAGARVDGDQGRAGRAGLVLHQRVVRVVDERRHLDRRHLWKPPSFYRSASGAARSSTSAQQGRTLLEQPRAAATPSAIAYVQTSSLHAPPGTLRASRYSYRLRYLASCSVSRCAAESGKRKACQGAGEGPTRLEAELLHGVLEEIVCERPPVLRLYLLVHRPHQRRALEVACA